MRTLSLPALSLPILISLGLPVGVWAQDPPARPRPVKVLMNWDVGEFRFQGDEAPISLRFSDAHLELKTNTTTDGQFLKDPAVKVIDGPFANSDSEFEFGIDDFLRVNWDVGAGQPLQGKQHIGVKFTYEPRQDGGPVKVEVRRATLTGVSGVSAGGEFTVPELSVPGPQSTLKRPGSVIWEIGFDDPAIMSPVSIEGLKFLKPLREPLLEELTASGIGSVPTLELGSVPDFVLPPGEITMHELAEAAFGDWLIAEYTTRVIDPILSEELEAPMEVAVRQWVAIGPFRDGDVDGDADTDNTDLGVILGNFTGPSGSDRQFADGDMDGDDDVDNTDVGAALGAFNGPIAEPAILDAGLSTVADLNYDPATGHVTLDASEASGGKIINFVLKNDPGGEDFSTGIAKFPYLIFNPMTSMIEPNGTATDLPTEISQSDGGLLGFTGLHALGEVFPTGMSAEELADYLTIATYVGAAGSGVAEFELFVVPEPSLLLLLPSLSLLVARWRRAAHHRRFGSTSTTA